MNFTKKKLKKHLGCFVALALLASVSQVQAATQGQTGRTSEGTVDVILTLKPNILITNLQDIRVMQQQDHFWYGYTSLCVASQSSGTQYAISARGKHEGAGSPEPFSRSASDGRRRFNLVSDGSESTYIPYALYYTADAVGNEDNEVTKLGDDDSFVLHPTLENKDFVTVNGGSRLDNSGDGSSILSCNPENNNGTLFVKVNEGMINSATDGRYTDTVTLTVSPI